MASSESHDPRLELILEALNELAAGRPAPKLEPSAAAGPCDAVMAAINRLSERLAAQELARGGTDERLGDILEVLMAFARLDFSVTAKRDRDEDDLDALAAGLNMLGEELEEVHQRLGHVNQVLRAIRRIDRIMVTEKNRGHLIQAVCNALVEARGYKRVWVRLVGEPGTTAFAEAAADLPSLADPMARDDPPPCQLQALAGERVLAIQRDRAPCSQCPHAASCSLQQAIMVSITHEGRSFGILAADALDATMAAEDEHVLFEEAAQDVGLALYNADVEDRRAAAERALKRAHQELRDTTAQVVHTARLAALGELAAGVAHELNQPLNGIKIITQSTLRYLNGLQPGELDSNLKETLALVGNMAETIDHMRFFSRRGEADDDTTVTVSSVVKGALKLVGQQARDHGIDLLIELGENLPPICCNPVRLEQALVNLVVNARDCLGACDKPDKRIEVRTYSRADAEAGRSMVVIEVRDNGTGIPEELRERVFEPFFTTKPPGAGTGLGLSLATKTMQQLDGRLEMESTVGEGTVFRLVIPAERPTDEAAQPDADQPT